MHFSSNYLRGISTKHKFQQLMLAVLFQNCSGHRKCWKMIKIPGTRNVRCDQCGVRERSDYTPSNKLVLTPWSTCVTSFQVAEFAVIASTSSRDVNLSLAVLNLWVKRKNYKTYSPLDVVAISLEASAAPSKSSFSRQVNNKQTF